MNTRNSTLIHYDNQDRRQARILRNRKSFETYLNVLTLDNIFRIKILFVINDS